MHKIRVAKIHCTNFRAFADREIDDLESGINVIVGDNDTGKSSVLLALDLVLRASVSKVQSYTLERLINSDAVSAYLASEDMSFAKLPNMEVDIHLSGCDLPEFYGEYNAKQTKGYGISMLCRPKDELADVLSEILADGNVFPFEYYTIEFRTFSGSPYSPYKKIVQHVAIDNTKISNDTASRTYIRDMYKANILNDELHRHEVGYRQAKSRFTTDHLATLNSRLNEEIEFVLRSDSKSNLETDLTIRHRNIDIDNIGMGMQCFIRTSFALSKKSSIDVVLLEEPENHLSQANMKRLIEQVADASSSQIFVATHSSYICSRLDLRKAIMFASPSEKPLRLKDVAEETAEFFMKTPQNSLLEFILSKKVLLLEGDSEYILAESLFENCTSKKLVTAGISVLAVGGIRFPRYLDVAKVLKQKVAVVTDNDGDVDSARLKRYRAYEIDNAVKIFHDSNVGRKTFEICLYEENKALCDKVFGSARRTISVQQYMLNYKTESAFALANESSGKLSAPSYLKEAMEWISA